MKSNHRSRDAGKISQDLCGTRSGRRRDGTRSREAGRQSRDTRGTLGTPSSRHNYDRLLDCSTATKRDTRRAWTERKGFGLVRDSGRGIARCHQATRSTVRARTSLQGCRRPSRVAIPGSRGFHRGLVDAWPSQLVSIERGRLRRYLRMSARSTGQAKSVTVLKLVLEGGLPARITCRRRFKAAQGTPYRPRHASTSSNTSRCHYRGERKPCWRSEYIQSRPNGLRRVAARH